MRRAAREPPGTMEGGGAYTCRQLSGGSSCTHGDNSFSYIHTHSYTHTYTHMYTHNTQHIHTCVHTTYTHKHMCTDNTHTRMNTQHIHVQIQHICTQTAHTYTHMYIDNIYTQTHIHTLQFGSVAQSCPTLHDPMNRSTPALPVHHQPPHFTQTHVHRVSDAIQPSHPLSSPSPPAPHPSQHQSLFQ